MGNHRAVLVSFAFQPWQLRYYFLVLIPHLASIKHTLQGGEDVDAKMEKLDMLLNKTNVYTQFLSDKLTSSNVYRQENPAPAQSASTQPEKKGRGKKNKTEAKDEKVCERIAFRFAPALTMI